MDSNVRAGSIPASSTRLREISEAVCYIFILADVKKALGEADELDITQNARKTRSLSFYGLVAQLDRASPF